VVVVQDWKINPKTNSAPVCFSAPILEFSNSSLCALKEKFFSQKYSTAELFHKHQYGCNHSFSFAKIAQNNSVVLKKSNLS